MSIATIVLIAEVVFNKYRALLSLTLQVPADDQLCLANQVESMAANLKKSDSPLGMSDMLQKFAETAKNMESQLHDYKALVQQQQVQIQQLQAVPELSLAEENTKLREEIAILKSENETLLKFIGASKENKSSQVEPGYVTVPATQSMADPMRAHYPDSAMIKKIESLKIINTRLFKANKDLHNKWEPLGQQTQEDKADLEAIGKSFETMNKNVKENVTTLEKEMKIQSEAHINELRRAPECFNECVSVQAAVSESADLHPDEPESQEHGRKFVVPPSFVFLPHDQQPGIVGPSLRWNKIAQLLSNQITNYRHLEAVMAEIAYQNPHHNPQNNRIYGPQSNPYERPDFRALEAYFQTLATEQYHQFFSDTLPNIQKLALRLPFLFHEPLLILKQRDNKEVTLSQCQVACLLANAFFNTFPEQNYNQNEGKPLQMPDFNFINLYSQMKSERKVEKLKCIVHYFERVTTNMPNGYVTYKRVYREPKGWMTLEAKLTKLHVSTKGTIEDERGFLQAVFASKFVGGGVLNTGLDQEAIRFVLCPEMIVSRLITEMLTSDEVLVMIGCERFSSYSGSSDTFKFTGNFFDVTESDEYGRKYTEVVAMDASVFKMDFYEQFQIHHVTRELNKAHCAFKGSGVRNLPAVCTGNWGCGAFGGDKQLKALIQLMAASVANRDICYLTFGDAELCLQIGHIYDILKTCNMSVKDIMQILAAYNKSTTSDSLFTFMENMISGNVHTAEKPVISS